LQVFSTHSDVVDVFNGIIVVVVVVVVVAGRVVFIVDGSVNEGDGGILTFIIGGSGNGDFVVFSTGGGNIYFILGGQHGIFGVAVVVEVVVGSGVVPVVSIINILIY
jgi:hypothetical protein